MYRGDGTQLVARLRARHLLDDGPLPLIGDGLVAALANRVADAAEVAATCTERLRERRRRHGDDELADLLDEARLGTRPTPMAAAVPALDSTPWPTGRS